MLVFVTLSLLSIAVKAGFPHVKPSIGAVWPKPQNEVSSSAQFLVSSQNISFVTMNRTCGILNRAVVRYQTMLTPKKGIETGIPKKSSPHKVYLNLKAPCETLPHLHMDERYELEVNSTEHRNATVITSNSIWGMLRGLESFSQLLVKDGSNYRINVTQIYDYPRFPHRGFLIDTSRHFLPIPYIEETLDLMSMNKMNVLHWHIVDTQSFPYQSAVYPDLSAKGAWSPNDIYTADDIAHVVDYATDRGIRVLPEFDTPGHTRSWGPGQPGLLTPCYKHGKPDGTYGPVDPTNEDNYKFIKRLFSEVTSRFPDHYLHLGGDEVPFNCWRSNPAINKFMASNNITSYSGLEEYYVRKLIKITADLPNRNGYLVWQEVFDNGVQLANDTVVHVWKLYSPRSQKEELAAVTAAGYKVILSACWYLDIIEYGSDWYSMYQCDPTAFNGTAAQKSLVVGGEACMWGEYVDKTNLISRSWPRGSVVAEKLWSAADATVSVSQAKPRIEEHRCRLLRRGYNVEPLWQSYCD